MFLSFASYWSGISNEKMLFTYDSSITPITPVISSCHVYTGGNYYMGKLNSTSNYTMNVLISTKTDTVTIQATWKIS